MRDLPCTHPPADIPRRTPHARALALLVCAVFFLTSCSSLTRPTKLEQPTIELAQVVLEKADLFAPEFRLTLRVENPNDEDIQVDGADAVLNLDGHAVAKGVSEKPVLLEAHQKSEVTIQATAKTLALARQLFKLDQQGQLPYVISGHLALARWLGGLGKVPFHVSGTLSRDELYREIEAVTGHRF